MPGCLSVSAADAPQSHWSVPCQGINLQLAHCHTHKHGLGTATTKLQCSSSKCSVGQSFAVPQSCCYLKLLFSQGLWLCRENTLCLQACTSAGGLGGDALHQKVLKEQ